MLIWGKNLEREKVVDWHHEAEPVLEWVLKRCSGLWGEHGKDARGKHLWGSKGNYPSSGSSVFLRVSDHKEKFLDTQTLHPQHNCLPAVFLCDVVVKYYFRMLTN